MLINSENFLLEKSINREFHFVWEKAQIDCENRNKMIWSQLKKIEHNLLLFSIEINRQLKKRTFYNEL